MKNKLLAVALLGFFGLLNFHLTASAQPVVATLAASGVTTNNAMLNGTVNPNGLAATVYFQYGLTSTYGNIGTLNSLPGTFASSALSNVVNSLTDPAGGAGSWGVRGSSLDWIAVASSADGTKLVAGVDNGQLYTSTDSGATWTPRASNQKWRSLASSADGTKLVAGGDGIIYTSTDSGVTWTLRSSVGASSVASSADGTKLVAANGNFYTSTDSGVTWTLRSGVTGSSVACSVDGSKLVVGNSGGQLYTSTDSGVTWTPRETNRNWIAVASSADGKKLLAAVTGYGGGFFTSSDSGVTWTAHLIDDAWQAVASSADGTRLWAASLVGYAAPVPGAQNRGAGHLFVSTNSGVTWTFDASGDWRSLASSADGTKLAGAEYWSSWLVGGNIITSAGIAHSLDINTTVHYQLVGINSAGSTLGADLTFTTRSFPPVATSLPATAVTAATATLNGTVNPGNGVTAAYFQYGLTASYGSVSATNTLGITNVTLSVSNLIASLSPGTTYHYRLVGSNSGGTSLGNDLTFTTSAAAPVVTTAAATAITATTATLNGTVNPGSAATTAYFQYGLTTSYGSFGAVNALTANNATVPVSNLITGLSPGTTYHYQLLGINSVGAIYGADLTFTTSAAAPAVTTATATAITTTTATLNGTVNPGNGATTAYFQYGLTTSYGSVSATNALAANNTTVAVSNLIASLSPGTTYHYRLVGGNSGGTSLGNDLTFTTSAAAPVVTTAAATAITATTAMLNGTVNPGNGATTAYFQYGLTTSYGSVSATNALAANNITVAVSNLLASLSPGTTYHYRLVGGNSGGTSLGNDLTFTTSAAAPVVTTAAASAITATSATLNGTVNPGNAVTTYFQYGRTTGYGSVTPPVMLTSGWALDFNGTDQFATTSSSVNLSNRSFSVEYWARRDGSNRWDVPLTQGAISSNHGLHVGFRNDNSFIFAFWDNDLSAAAGYSDNAWHHWACTYNQTNNQRLIYRDGVVIAADTASSPYLENSPLLIARSAQLNADFGGALDELRVWNGVRTPAQINAFLDTTVAGTEPGLLAYWRFDESTGASAGDSSGHGNTAALTSSPAWISGIVQPGANAALAGLTANTLYHFRVVASNSGGTNFGGDLTFTTASSQPVNFILNVAMAFAGGAFQMSFTNLSGLPFTVLGTTNLELPLSNWDVLGAPTESPPGQYQFTGSPTTNSRARFYRVRSP